MVKGSKASTLPCSLMTFLDWVVMAMLASSFPACACTALLFRLGNTHCTFAHRVVLAYTASLDSFSWRTCHRSAYLGGHDSIILRSCGQAQSLPPHLRSTYKPNSEYCVQLQCSLCLLPNFLCSALAFNRLVLDTIGRVPKIRRRLRALSLQVSVILSLIRSFFQTGWFRDL